MTTNHLLFNKINCFFWKHWPFNSTFKVTCSPSALLKDVLSNFICCFFSHLSPVNFYWVANWPTLLTNMTYYFTLVLWLFNYFLQVAIDHLLSNKTYSTDSSRDTDYLTIFYRWQSTTCCRTRRTASSRTRSRRSRTTWTCWTPCSRRTFVSSTTRRYRMTQRVLNDYIGPGFLAVVWFGSSPTLSSQ